MMRRRTLSIAALVLGLGCWRAALAQERERTQRDAAPVNAQIAAANAALEAHDYEAAVKLLMPLAETRPKDAHVLYDLGSAQDALDQATAAEQSYHAAIANDQAMLDPHVALGLMLARGGHFEEARVELGAVKTTASQDGPLKARAFRALARIDQKARPGEARDELLEALKLSPETPEDTILAAELTESAAGGGAAAEATYRRVLAAHPNDPAATADLAKLLVKELRAEDAEKLLTAALDANPGNPALTVQLASFYGGEGKLADALPLVEGLHAANPRDANVSRLLGGLYLDMKNYAQAEPLLAAASGQNPRDARLADEHARALIQMRKFAEAEQILARIVAQPGSFASPSELGSAAFDLAFAASSNNDPQVALQALALRATLLPTSAPVLFLTAISHDKLHHTKLAIVAYKQFLEVAKGSNPDEEFEARHRIVALEHMR